MAFVSNSKKDCPRKNYIVEKTRAEVWRWERGVLGSVRKSTKKVKLFTGARVHVNSSVLFSKCEGEPSFSIQSLKAIKSIQPCRQISPWWHHLGGP